MRYIYFYSLRFEVSNKNEVNITSRNGMYYSDKKILDDSDFFSFAEQVYKTSKECGLLPVFNRASMSITSLSFLHEVDE